MVLVGAGLVRAGGFRRYSPLLLGSPPPSPPPADGVAREAAEQGLDEDQVRSAVVDRTGKSIDDLTAAELGPLVEAATNKLRQMQQAQAA